MAEGDVELGHVDVDHTVQLLLKYDGVEVQNRSDQRPGSIFMVPKVYRDLSPRSYTPQVVSIGPLHHEDEHLKGFEVQKATYMHNLFHNVLLPRDSTPEQILKECVTKVSDSVDKIKACYVRMPTYSDSELVKMMVTDACFILAFLFEHDIRYSSLGPIKLLYTDIVPDMVLIENQIPFFVLQDIFECTFLKLQSTLSLADFLFLIQRWCNIYEGDLVTGNSGISSTHDHILGFLHKSYQNPDLDRSRLHGQDPKAHSVVELDRSGVRFSKKHDAMWPMAMELEFKRSLSFPFSLNKPTLKMPVLRLVDKTELVLRNLIIYEHNAEVPACVTSYMYAMDMLIDTPEDVTRLVKSKVLVNRLGSEENAANLVNRMLEGVPIRDFYYQDEWKQIHEYMYYPVVGWRKVKSDFARKYFSNPWSAIALLAGIVLFVLTVVQTVYSVNDSKAA